MTRDRWLLLVLVAAAIAVGYSLLRTRESSESTAARERTAATPTTPRDPPRDTSPFGDRDRRSDDAVPELPREVAPTPSSDERRPDPPPPTAPPGDGKPSPGRIDPHDVPPAVAPKVVSSPELEAAQAQATKAAAVTVAAARKAMSDKCSNGTPAKVSFSLSYDDAGKVIASSVAQSRDGFDAAFGDCLAKFAPKFAIAAPGHSVSVEVPMEFP